MSISFSFLIILYLISFLLLIPVLVFGFFINPAKKSNHKKSNPNHSSQLDSTQEELNVSSKNKK